MDTILREANVEDARRLGDIFFDALGAIAQRHSFPVEFPSREYARTAVTDMVGDDRFFGIVAERDRRVAGCAFLDERGVIVGVGPVVVDPSAQDAGIGRLMTEEALRRERTRGAAGVRLIQATYHVRSMGLYAKLGFEAREPLSVVHGTPRRVKVPGVSVRAATERDLDACGHVCVQVHGHDRKQELLAAIAADTARVVERSDRISGYTTDLGYEGHAVGEGNDDIIALISSTDAFSGLGIRIPSTNSGLLRWCLQNGLKIAQQSILMTVGLYNDPQGAWIPSDRY
jgi:GNAT superfamily N-acetyltransferase